MLHNKVGPLTGLGIYLCSVEVTGCVLWQGCRFIGLGFAFFLTGWGLKLCYPIILGHKLSCVPELDRFKDCVLLWSNVAG